MATFKDRKAARIAAGHRSFKFNVLANFPFSDELMGSFDSRTEAEDFAFKQVGPFVGDTQALRLLFERHKNVYVSPGQTFSVRREDVSAAK